MKNLKNLSQVTDINQIKEAVRKLVTNIDPTKVLERAGKELNKANWQHQLDSKSTLFKALTLYEFDNGALMATTVAEQYKTFAIELSRQLQEEFRCQTASEKATAELATINFIRTLEIQRRIDNYLAKGTIDHLGAKFLEIMSQELDRANRHYLTAIQALRMMRQAPLQVTIKTKTAVVGQNQIIQANNHDKPI